MFLFHHTLQYRSHQAGPLLREGDRLFLECGDPSPSSSRRLNAARQSRSAITKMLDSLVPATYSIENLLAANEARARFSVMNEAAAGA